MKYKNEKKIENNLPGTFPKSKPNPKRLFSQINKINLKLRRDTSIFL
jgi:hypothetical protein